MTPSPTDPEYRALLAGVLAHPRDDAPRLVLADWVQDRGLDELAAFIRWSCEHKRTVITNRLRRPARALSTVETEGTPSETCYGRPPHMTDEMFVWFKKFSSEVVAPTSFSPPATPESAWTTMCERSGWDFVWHRGFVARLRMPADDAFDRLGGLLENWPITTVVLSRRLSDDRADVLRNRFLTQLARHRPKTLTAKLFYFFGGRVRFREDYPRSTGYRLPEGFHTTIAFGRRPEVEIWGGHD